jgi:UDP-glucuronate decarboxylase
VDDLLGGLVAFMDQDQAAGPVNLGNPVESSMLELAEQVLRLTGSRSRLVFQPLPEDDPRQRCPDISKAKALLGWQPRVTLEEGLGRTIEYFRNTLSVN